jgi:hypothetical protein
MLRKGTSLKMRKICKTDSQAAASWLPMAYESGGIPSQSGWPKFSSCVEDFPEFKDRWHKISKVGISDKMLLRILEEHSLASNIARRPDRFTEVADEWRWL